MVETTSSGAVAGDAVASGAVLLEGNTPLLLNGCDDIWLIEAGAVDIFAIRYQDGGVVGARHPLFRVEAGQAIFGIPCEAQAKGVALMARGVTGTRIRKIGLAELQALCADVGSRPAGIGYVVGWVRELSESLVREMPSRNYLLLMPQDADVTLAVGQLAHAASGVVWVKFLGGKGLFLSRAGLPLEGTTGYFPLATSTWVEAAGESKLAVRASEQVLADGALWPALEQFYLYALDCVLGNIEQYEAAERQRLAAVDAADQAVLQSALRQLSGVLKDTRAGSTQMESGEQPLLAACRMVGESMGIAIRPPLESESGRTQRDPIAAIARASHIRTRKVVLRDDWWRGDNGPLLAFMEQDKRPVALLPSSERSYLLADPATGTSVPVTAEVAEGLDSFGYSFFRSLPAHSLHAWDLVRFGLRGAHRDLRTILVMGTLAGVLGLVIPMATRFIFDTIIPLGDRYQLFGLAAVLIVASIASALFQFVRGIALLRIETRMTATTQAAVWDRLLNLPVAFFRQYSAGSLAMRAMGIDQIRQILTGTILSSLLAGIFSLFYVLLLFSYDASLAVLALFLVAIAVAATSAFSSLQLRYERELYGVQATLSGTVFQLINGITKLRIAGAEPYAFAVWAEQFARQRRLSLRSRVITNMLTTFNAAFPILTSLVLFAAIVLAAGDGRSTGTYLAFIVAYTTLQASALEMSSGLLSALRVIPIYENAKPILDTIPEVNTARYDPGELQGKIEVNHASFRYKPDGPLILDDVSLAIKPGEFVAFVGPSGAGKSTVLRLLLGFETPEQGAIYFDGQDLSKLDLQAVRNQIGVVMQQARLMPGDIMTNILGSAPLTEADAWVAATMAGLDRDIKNMPMGMHTMVSEGAGTLSGGQRQRLMIARAIVTKPRILFFDEATSALDNETQAIVSRSLENLRATRIVIAHRLSTILHADRIFVINGGKIVQTGTYEELAGQPGLFRDLIQRQLA